MSMQLDTQVAESGTRFRIFPQPPYLPSFKEPETTYVSVPVGKVETGPADDRMYVIDAIRKRPYSDFDGPTIWGLVTLPSSRALMGISTT